MFLSVQVSWFVWIVEKCAITLHTLNTRIKQNIDDNHKSRFHFPVFHQRGRGVLWLHHHPSVWKQDQLSHSDTRWDSSYDACVRRCVERQSKHFVVGCRVNILIGVWCIHFVHSAEQESPVTADLKWHTYTALPLFVSTEKNYNHQKKHPVISFAQSVFTKQPITWKDSAKLRKQLVFVVGQSLKIPEKSSSWLPHS